MYSRGAPECTADVLLAIGLRGVNLIPHQVDPEHIPLSKISASFKRLINKT